MDTIPFDFGQQRNAEVHVSLHTVAGDNINLQVSFQRRSLTSGATFGGDSTQVDARVVQVGTSQPPCIANGQLQRPRGTHRTTSEVATQTSYDEHDNPVISQSLVQPDHPRVSEDAPSGEAPGPPCVAAPAMSPQDNVQELHSRDASSKDSGSDTEPENDPIHNTYMLGYWDGHEDGKQAFRKEALKRLEKVAPDMRGEEGWDNSGDGHEASQSAVDWEDAQRWSPPPSQRRSASPQTYIPPPKFTGGLCAHSENAQTD
ncbi:hypothetical protein C8Q79DRAFT_927758 [Trametes meyenii]|nr:hypothetical protein C8Q79DRAFT_927758 [Trametes meyenii]